MNHQIQAPIFCLPKDLEINEFSEMIDWAHDHKDSETVLILNGKDVERYHMDGLWNIISEITGNAFFGMYEDDWIFDYEIMQDIVNALDKSQFSNEENVKKMKCILKYAIKYERSVVFYI